jgi:hypothetical protein
MAVKTKHVAGRRELQFHSQDEVLADAQRLAAGHTRTLGNWSLGQILSHLARSVEAAIDGTLPRPPWWLAWVIRGLKQRFLTKPMPAGFQLPRRRAENLLPPATSTAEGLAQLQAAVARMRREGIVHPHPAFGVMTAHEWDQLFLRHAELHLSFVLCE